VTRLSTALPVSAPAGGGPSLSQPPSEPAVTPHGDGFLGTTAAPFLVLLLSFAAVAGLLLYAVRMELGPG
jgi:hypothetical protein